MLVGIIVVALIGLLLFGVLGRWIYQQSEYGQPKSTVTFVPNPQPKEVKESPVAILNEQVSEKIELDLKPEHIVCSVPPVKEKEVVAEVNGEMHHRQAGHTTTSFSKPAAAKKKRNRAKHTKTNNNMSNVNALDVLDESFGIVGDQVAAMAINNLLNSGSNYVETERVYEEPVKSAYNHSEEPRYNHYEEARTRAAERAEAVEESKSYSYSAPSYDTPSYGGGYGGGGGNSGGWSDSGSSSSSDSGGGGGDCGGGGDD